MVLSVCSFVFSLLVVFVILWMWGASWGVVVSLFPWSFALSDLEFIYYFDSVVALCLLMLSICSLLALVYCFHYFQGSSDVFSLFYLMVLFVAVMGVLMCSGSLIFTLFMWEYLGFVSFLLILFYSNSDGARASLITLFSSRFGDVGLFVLIACSSFSFSVSVFFFFSFFFVVVTKSACFPFVSWLLEAMRAPTPVSSLVHSSTLVAAGVWFVLSYGVVLESSGFLFYVFVSSLLTIVITGLAALFFLDLKKIVALSTCNNIAWCLLYYVCGDLFLVVFQLLVHGVCKCVLFILVGDLMSSSGGSQSLVGLYVLRYSSVWVVFLLSFVIFSLCGVPFLGIFFSKHFFLSCLTSSVWNFILVALVYFCLSISYAYSFRLVLLVCSSVRGLSSGYYVPFIFVVLFVLIGSLCSWLCYGCFELIVELSYFVSFVFLLVQFFGFLVGYLVFLLSCDSSFWWSLLCGSDSLVGFVYSIYSRVVSLSLVAVYRWEVSLFSLVGCYLDRYVVLGLFVFSLNFTVLGVFFYVVLCLLA
nr:NADH dehydrogenase subunit 5 [Strigea falconis]